MRINQLCSGLLCSLALVSLSVNCSQREPAPVESTPSMETTGTGTPADMGAGTAGDTTPDTSGTLSGAGTMGSDTGAMTDGSMGDTTGTAGSTTGTETEAADEATTTTETPSSTEQPGTKASAHGECKNMSGKALDDCMKKMHSKNPTKTK